VKLKSWGIQKLSNYWCWSIQWKVISIQATLELRPSWVIQLTSGWGFGFNILESQLWPEIELLTAVDPLKQLSTCSCGLGAIVDLQLSTCSCWPRNPLLTYKKLLTYRQLLANKQLLTFRSSCSLATASDSGIAVYCIDLRVIWMAQYSCRWLVSLPGSSLLQLLFLLLPAVHPETITDFLRGRPDLSEVRTYSRYLMSRLSLQGFYLWRHVLPTAPPFVLWRSNLEILFAPLHRSSPFIGGLRCHKQFKRNTVRI
jgi:hypothetical protein